VGYTHITGRHIGGDTDITSDMCMGYRYHGDTHITVTPPSWFATEGQQGMGRGRM